MSVTQISHSQLAAEYILNDIPNSKQLDTKDISITDDYISKGIRHIYAKRTIANLEVYNSYAAIHLLNNTRITAQQNLYPYLTQNSISNRPALVAKDAIKLLVNSSKGDDHAIQLIYESQDHDKASTFIAPSVAYNEISAKLKLLLLVKSDLRYVWSIEIDEVDSGKWKNYFVDAQSGEILKEENWTVECNHHQENQCNHQHQSISTGHMIHAAVPNSMMTDSSYNVFDYPVESPNYGSRSISERPWLDNPLASPNGWHQIGMNQYTTTHGNNVDAYLDANNTNSPSNGDADRADGGVNMQFDFSWDETTAPDLLPLPAITNLFYWSNVVHDVWYNYGFDEASGNFQSENNNATGGNANDYVQAEAQDGSGSCNANMATPPDGSKPRMQMYLCNSRDGDFDNGVIVHEYGHGISNRLTGGPAAAGCLGNQEQMGEGWSDWLGLMMTIESGDVDTDSRPIGTWLFGQGPNDPGIRPYPYTTDMTVNPMTYASSFSGVSVPHGVGSVWCTMLWDLTWAMINEYGFDSDLYIGTGGNNKTMHLVLEGMKLQPCSPGFVDARDAIIAADEAINGGANVCLIWEVFANRGLGYSASQGSSASRSDGTEAFDMPPTCTLELQKTTVDTEVSAGDMISYNLISTNHHTADQTNLVVTDPVPDNTTFVSASDAGSESGGTITWPSVSLDIDQIRQYQFTVQVDSNLDPVVDDVFDDMESGTSNWATAASGSTSWVLQSATVYSGSNAWKAVDGASPGGATLQYAFDLGIGNDSRLLFVHSYDTEATWDGGQVEISSDNGKTWTDLKDDFVVNGYNSIIFNSIPGFSGDSGGFITSEIDLSAYDGLVVLVRFVMNCDQAVGGNGWYIDDVFIQNLNRYIPNIASATTDQYSATGKLAAPTKVLVGANDFKVEGNSTNLLCIDVNDGTATAIPSGGSGSYSYLWSTGATTASISGLAQGAYYCDVSDGTLTRKKYFFISAPLLMEADVNVTHAIGGSNGMATAIATGGIMPYTYLWSTSETTQSISGLAAGTYMLTVTDANMCDDVVTFVVNDNIDDCADRPFVIEVLLDQYPEELSYQVTDVNDNVVVTQDFTGFDDGAFFKDVVCLADGCYTLTVVDSYGDGICNAYSTPNGYVKLKDYYSDTELVNECDFTTFTFDFCVDPLEAELIAVNPSCYGEEDGSLSIVISNDIYDYTYSWSTGATTSSIDNIGAGDYSVTISDGIDQVILDHTLTHANSLVYTDADSGAGSLRQVLSNACLVDTITFDQSLIADTIFLLSEIEINKSVHIEGMSIYGTIISGSDQTRLFSLGFNDILSLNGMRLIDATQTPNGGAIYNLGELILEDVVIENSSEGSIPKVISGDGNTIIKGNVTFK